MDPAVAQALTRRFVLVLVVVLVLESGQRGVMEYWSVGVLRQVRIAPRGRGVGGADGGQNFLRR
jgi:hypothetical protein